MPDNAGRTLATATARGSHLVRKTLAADSTPSTTIEDAASVKKFPGLAACIDSHQPPPATNTKRAVCASTGPKTFAAPCDEKYIDIDKPMNAYIGAAIERY